MIGIILAGQLGNQMFQYAAARIQAERLSSSLFVESHRGLRRGLRGLVRLQPGCELFEAFPALDCNPISAFSPFLVRGLPGWHEQFKQWLFSSEFSPGALGPARI